MRDHRVIGFNRRFYKFFEDYLIERYLKMEYYWTRLFLAASSGRELLLRGGSWGYGPAGIPIGPSPERLKYLLRRGPCECMVEAVSPLFPYEYSLHNKPLILKLYYLEFLVFSILKSLKNMN